MRELFRAPDARSGPYYLALSGVSAALIYGALLARLPLLRLYTIPLQNLNHMARSEWPLGLLVIGCILFLFGGYALGALGAAARRPGRSAPALIVGFPLLFIALLLLVQPITSTDLYDYAFRGRMLAHYQTNTFVSAPDAFPNDPLYGYLAWPHWVTAYGPLWERMSWLAAQLAGESPGAAVDPTPAQLFNLLMVYKGLAVLGFLLCGAAIWATLKRDAPERRWLGLYLWLWNPLALWESAATGHNDVWMALLIVLALWAMGHRRAPDGNQPDVTSGSPFAQRLAPLFALLMLTAGGLIKFVAFFFGPIVLAAALRRLTGWRERLRLAALGGAACITMMAAAYAPFWSGWDTLRNVGDRGRLFTASWLAALHAMLQGPIGDQAGTLVAAIGMALLLAGVIWATWRAWRAPHDLAAHVLWLTLWFLFVCNAWFQPWYVIWPLAFAALQPWRTRIVWAVGLFCLTALVSYVFGGLLLPGLGLDERSALRESLISALLYGPPLAVLAWGRSIDPLGWWRSLRRLPQALGSRRQRVLKGS